MTTSKLVENFFRYEYSKLVALLSHRIGIKHIEYIEDAVQSSLIKALENWKINSEPDNPSAWLYKVAYNDVIGELRKESNRKDLVDKKLISDLSTNTSTEININEFDDDLLRMLFVCCDERIPQDSQLVIALKILCGFSIKEISQRLFISEENVYKRYSRAKKVFQKLDDFSIDLSTKEYKNRLKNVCKVLYLLFTEGYFSTHDKNAIRKELCNEAIRLTTILAKNKLGNNSEIFALIALMHFHNARIDSRINEIGEIFLLEEQDRSLWNQEEIAIGLEWLTKSAIGEKITRYHIEAGIAAEHCLAKSFKETRWNKIIEYYNLLKKIDYSPIHTLNKAIAIAESGEVEKALKIINNFNPPTWLEGSYIWYAVNADLYKRLGNKEKFIKFKETSLNLAPTKAIKELLNRRLSN